MKTSVNGVPGGWTPVIWALWNDKVASNPDYAGAYDANYFTPRPYVDEWNRGDLKEGFTFTVKRSVHQVIVNGYPPWLVAEPKRMQK